MLNLKTFLLLLFVLFTTLLAKDVNHINFSISRLGEPVLDPHIVQGDLELHLNPNIYDGLYKIDPSSGKLKPALALSHRWIDSKTIEFDLRKGVTFHNGEKFNAYSVQYSFNRMKNVKNGFNWINAIIPEYKSVEILDPYKIRIHFEKHNSIFLISSRFFIILPPKYIEKYGDDYFQKHPVGTGAFYVDKIDYNNQQKITKIELKKYKNYWEKSLPKLDGVSYYFNMTQEESLKSLIDKKMDAIADVSVRSLLEIKKNGYDISSKKQGLLTWLYFNLTKYKIDTPIYDKKVREAILYAIDYDKIIKIVYKNYAKVNNQWAFPNLPGYSNELQNYHFDIDKAKELLKEANIKKEITFHMYCDDVSLDEAKIIKSSLNKIGIKVTIDILTEAQNNCILTAKNNLSSPCHKKLKYYDFMIGDFGWGLPHNYVSHLHTFSQNSFASLMDINYPGAKESTMMYQGAVNSYENSDKAWESITEYEFNRLGISGLFLKDTFFAKSKDLIWEVYGSYDFTNGYLKSDK